MENSSEPREFELPLEFQFAMRKAELQADEMCWEQLHSALLNLYYQRLMEWQAVREILAGENIDLTFEIPTNLELEELAAACMYASDDEDEDDEENCVPF
jgi:hypothetical protein